MIQRFNLAQFKSKMRQFENKRRQAINRYNQSIRNIRRAVDNYNREVRAYNSRARTHQQKVRSELARLQRQQSASYSSYRASVSNLHKVYVRLEQSAATRTLSPQENYYLDLSERENANSLNVLNTLLESERESQDAQLSDLQQTKIGDEIAIISEDFDSRWKGALYSLNPNNPDASRHFCSSVREILAGILELKAPDNMVESFLPDCQRTEKGSPTRRSKIRYLLLKKELENEVLVEFIDSDISNIIGLFDILNTGTHGEAGRFDLTALASIKTRVEDGLIFLSRIAT